MDNNQENNKPLSRVLSKLFKRKNPDDMMKVARRNGLKKTLTAIDLIVLGIGILIGSGIFAVVGIAAATPNTGAGPALVVSMIIAAFACVFSALCYCEFAAMLPVAGGAYVYTFATLGEFMAWMVGCVLMLEYGIGSVGGACAWSNYFVQFLKGFEGHLPNILTNMPIWLTTDYNSAIKLLGDNAQNVLPTIFGLPIFAIAGVDNCGIMSVSVFLMLPR